MKSKFLLAAAALLASATVADAADKSLLSYLPEYDQLALRMLTCADIVENDGPRIQGMDSKQLAGIADNYNKAGRAAVVRAALEAPGSSPAPKIPSISFTSKHAEDAVTADLRAHEKQADLVYSNLRRTGFDISSFCASSKTLDEAAKLNDWFASDTSVLTKVK